MFGNRRQQTLRHEHHDHHFATLAKVHAPATAALASATVLHRYAGDSSVLTQIATLEKKVFAKRASWTGVCKLQRASARAQK